MNLLLKRPLRFIRIKPEWNVNLKKGDILSASNTIRIKPEWNVNKIEFKALPYKKLIRIKPEWNVNFLVIGNSEKAVELE